MLFWRKMTVVYLQFLDAGRPSLRVFTKEERGFFSGSKEHVKLFLKILDCKVSPKAGTKTEIIIEDENFGKAIQFLCADSNVHIVHDPKENGKNYWDELSEKCGIMTIEELRSELILRILSRTIQCRA